MYSGTYLVATNAKIAGILPEEKLLLVCKSDNGLPPFPYDDWRGWIISAAYPYSGGLE
jgi:hypothetical protein